LLEEFCNIGNLGADFLKQLAILRGFNINCQLLVQSVPQLAGRYPRAEWEELISHCDLMMCLGANDLKTGAYFSDKCGKVTIRVDNNQMPLMPLFSPVYNSTRPYSQTRSNTQRALMMPDEILRMDNGKCLILLRGQKPLILDKITPEEFPVFAKLKKSRITEYAPKWRENTPAARDADAVPPYETLGVPEDGTESPFSEDSARSGAPHAPAAGPRDAGRPDRREAGGGNDGKTASHSGAWYPKTEYALTDDADGETPGKEHAAGRGAQTEIPAGKYGALKPVDITPEAVRDRGIALQNGKEE
jgi:type IV secretion system protein VirD4